MDKDIQAEIQKLLSQLRDVHEPAISWWPLAPGWWLVAALLLSLCFAVALWFYRRDKRLRWTLVAKEELNALQKDFENGRLSEQVTVSRLAVLMRRSAMAANGRQGVARATDAQWVDIILDVGNRQGFGRSAAEALVTAAYKAKPLPRAQVSELLVACHTWLNGARRTRRRARV